MIMLLTLLPLDITFKDLFGVEFFNQFEFWRTVLRFFYNLLIVLVIARVIYYRSNPRPEYVFSYLLISSIAFIICSLLDVVTFQIGFAIGLFAIFGIIRYRTSPIPIREMTYLFIVLGLSVKNALADVDVSFSQSFFADTIIIIITWLSQDFLVRNKMITKTIVYNNIELLKPENYERLLLELSEESGFKIEKAEVGRVDYVKRQARIRISFFQKDAPHNYSDDGD